MGLAVLGTPVTLVTLAAAVLVGRAVMGGVFRVASPEKALHLREGLGLLLEVTETQVAREIHQRRVCLGIIFRVVPQGLAGLAGL